MALQTINVGTAPNDGTGDPLRVAFEKINDNFAELYNAAINVGGTNTQVQFNDDQEFAGSVNFTFNKNTQTLQIGSNNYIRIQAPSEKITSNGSLTLSTDGGSKNFVLESSGNLVVPGAELVLDTKTITITSNTLSVAGELYATQAYVDNAISIKANTADLSNVAFTGEYSDLLNAPVLATVATTGNYNDLSNTPDPYVLPTANTTQLGGVKVDGTTITIDGSGVISAAPATTAAGNNTQIQFNTNNDFDASADLTFDSSTSILQIGTTPNVGITIDGTNGVINSTAANSDLILGANGNGRIILGSSVSPILTTGSGQSLKLIGNTSVIIQAQNNDIIFQRPNNAESLRINNYGALALGNTTNYGTSGQVLKTNGNLTSPSWLSLATVATSGAYGDLTGAPTIPTLTSQLTNDSGFLTSVSWTSVTGKPTFATVATTGNYNDLSNTPGLALVATTGNYNDLINKPSVTTYSAGSGLSLANNTFSVDSTVVRTSGSQNITTTGDITANNLSGNISITGNVIGTSPNVELVAGSYTCRFDNTGILTLPTMGGDEGGEINLGVPETNTTLTTRVVMDVYRDRFRIFDGSTKGAYIDLSQASTGVGTLLNNRVSGIVNAGTFVTMDNIKATVTTSGQRGLSLATVTGSFTYDIGGTFAGFGVGSGGTSTGGQTLTTTPTSSIFGWGFTNQGDIATYIITNISSLLTYRITLQIGGGFNNNRIVIERLI